MDCRTVRVARTRRAAASLAVRRESLPASRDAASRRSGSATAGQTAAKGKTR